MFSPRLKSLSCEVDVEFGVPFAKAVSPAHLEEEL